MRLRMDQLGPERAGKRISWWVGNGEEAPRHQVWTRRMPTRAKVLHRHGVSGYGEPSPDGVVLLACEPVAGRTPGPFYVGAHWPVDVEDAA